SVTSSISARILSDTAMLRERTTSDLLAMDEEGKFDAWGKPFCIIPLKAKVAIVSGGPSRLACDKLPLTAEQIATSTRALYAAPLDVVVVTVTQSSTSRPDCRKQVLAQV